MRILENLQKVTSVSSCEFCELIHSVYSVKHQLRKTFTQNKSSCNSTKKEIQKSVQIRRFFWYVFLPAGKYGPGKASYSDTCHTVIPPGNYFRIFNPSNSFSNDSFTPSGVYLRPY